MTAEPIAPDILKRAEQLISAWGRQASAMAARRAQEAERFGDRAGAARWQATRRAIDSMIAKPRIA